MATPAHALPAKLSAMCTKMQTIFSKWVETDLRVGKQFFSELVVSDLDDDERTVLMGALVADGFDVCHVEYDLHPPCRVFHVKCVADAGRMRGWADKRILAIIADVSRRFTDWLVSNQCDILDNAVWDVDATGLSEPERAMLIMLLECHGFRVTRGAGISVDTIFLHRTPGAIEDDDAKGERTRKRKHR
jgi:hypothetical protein